MLYSEIENARSDGEYTSAWRRANVARAGHDKSVTINGHRINVPGNPEVFSPDPAMTYSTQMLLNLAGDFNGKSVLDMGTGTGAIAVVAAKSGARRVVATDIHSPSLTCAQGNVLTNALGDRVTVIESDVFENVRERFDLIVANLPFGDIYSHLSIDRNSIACQFFTEAQNHLNAGGRVLAAGASFGNIADVRKLLKDIGLDHREHKERKFGVEWSVFEFRAELCSI